MDELKGYEDWWTLDFCFEFGSWKFRRFTWTCRKSSSRYVNLFTQKVTKDVSMAF